VKSANAVLSAQPTTIFSVISALAVEHKAVNLGQGFPDTDGPADIRETAARHAMEGPNQYPPMLGLPELRQAVADHDRRFYGIEADWQTDVLVTSGATEALTASLMGLLNPGDEVVLIEPVYDCYRPIVEAMGAIAKPVRLQPPHWSLPIKELREAFSPHTKALVLNNPMNPIGKVFTRDELETLAELVETFDTYVVCDEVYEHLVFAPATFIPMITLPGLEKRCLKIGSAGKSFSLTGWKVGYITACAELLEPVAKAHQFLTFTTPPNLQLAVAQGLKKEESYFDSLAQEMARGRQSLADGLQEIGWQTLPCDGTYFLVADISSFSRGQSDLEFCKKLIAEAGVALIPLSPFYGPEAPAPQDFVRFCFCKSDERLESALNALSTWTDGV